MQDLSKTNTLTLIITRRTLLSNKNTEIINFEEAKQKIAARQAKDEVDFIKSAVTKEFKEQLRDKCRRDHGFTTKRK